MNLRLRTLLAMTVILLLPALSAGQTGAFLTVHSAPPGLAVYRDTTLVGRTPVDSVPVPSGTMVLRVLSARERSWEGPALIETLTVRPAEHVVRDVAPLRIGRITSEPDGAQVSLGDSLIGSTPLLVPLRAQGSLVTVARDGYESASLPFTGDMHVVLAARAGTTAQYLAGEHSAHLTPVILSTGVSVLAGATAAYCKIKADARYADYRTNGKASDLDAVHRLDLLSGISLAVSELSLFLLTYQLLSR